MGSCGRAREWSGTGDADYSVTTMRFCHFPHQTGFSYVEMLLAVAITGLIMAGLMGVVNTATETSDDVRQRNQLTRQARFAMERMVRQVSHSRKLLLPLRDNPATNWPENIREQTVPPSAPIGDSTLATAVLVVSLPAYIDLDGNGIPDADNDADGLLDEDLPGDIHNDDKPGIRDIDDDGNGVKDFLLSPAGDDDESNDFSENEDTLNGIDDDGDGSIDEDPSSDMNGDACPGFCGVDDDSDGLIDEGSGNDDDEDGQTNEDWYDPLVIYLENGVLKQRNPVPWDESGDSVVTGQDFIVSDIAANVTRFRVERLDIGSTVELLDLTLELTSPVSGESISLQTRVRLGGAL